jgi:hypothetical protein
MVKFLNIKKLFVLNNLLSTYSKVGAGAGARAAAKFLLGAGAVSKLRGSLTLICQKKS